MGIMSGLAKRMLRERVRYEVSGKLLTLGEQTVFLLPSQMEEIAHEIGLPVNIDLKRNLPEIDEDDLFISSECFFKSLGADIVNSLDISKYQNADILFNLNCPDLPDELRNSFDCIFDGSTTEHIFDIHQVFKNLHQILTPGGVIFHLSPLEGLAHDSFYQFGLNFFSELYGVNGYEQIFHQIYVYDYEHLIYAPSKIEKAGTDWFFDDPVEGLNFARKNDLPAQHLFMAKKPKGQTKKLISPLQARYSQNTNWQKSLKKNSGL